MKLVFTKEKKNSNFLCIARLREFLWKNIPLKLMLHELTYYFRRIQYWIDWRGIRIYSCSNVSPYPIADWRPFHMTGIGVSRGGCVYGAEVSPDAWKSCRTRHMYIGPCRLVQLRKLWPLSLKKNSWNQLTFYFWTHLIRNPSHDSKSESRTGSVNKTELHSMLTTELITIVHEVAMYIFTLSNLVHVCISYRWRSG